MEPSVRFCKRQVSGLADGHDHLIRFNLFSHIAKCRAKISPFIKHAGALNQLYAGKAAIPAQDFPRTPGGEKLDPFSEGPLELLYMCGHFLTALQTDHGHILRPASQRCTRCINRHISPSNHNNMMFQTDLSPLSNLCQKLHAPQDIGHMRPFNNEPLAQPGPYR